MRILVLGPGDEAVLQRVVPGVFDEPVDAAATATFLADERHHMAVALEEGRVVGCVTGVDYVQPDQPHPTLWINEIGVAPDYRGQGVGSSLLKSVMDVGQRRGCREAWVLTERHNAAAVRLYLKNDGFPAPNDIVLFSFDLT